jgi:hypothetical protein
MPTGTPTGGVSASVLITAAVGLVSGAVFGLLLGQIISQPVLVAVVASFLAILVASAVRYFIVSAGAGASFPGGGPAAMPSVLFINSLIASVFGGLAAHGLLAAASPNSPSAIDGSGCRPVRRRSDGAADDLLLHGSRRGLSRATLTRLARPAFSYASCRRVARCLSFGGLPSGLAPSLTSREGVPCSGWLTERLAADHVLLEAMTAPRP